jgi:hypothetical protein
MTPAEAQALNVVMRRRLCAHEAGHCAAALIGGLDVREAWAGDHDVTVEPSDPDQAANADRRVTPVCRGLWQPETLP